MATSSEPQGRPREVKSLLGNLIRSFGALSVEPHQIPDLRLRRQFGLMPLGIAIPTGAADQ